MATRYCQSRPRPTPTDKHMPSRYRSRSPNAPKSSRQWTSDPSHDIAERRRSTAALDRRTRRVGMALTKAGMRVGGWITEAGWRFTTNDSRRGLVSDVSWGFGCAVIDFVHPRHVSNSCSITGKNIGAPRPVARQPLRTGQRCPHPDPGNAPPGRRGRPDPRRRRIPQSESHFRVQLHPGDSI
jgi:hypothetical protein